MSFWGELKRRNVAKVGAAYVIVGWLIVQVANTFFTLLSFPKWAAPMVAVLVILGFPLALLFAWAFEMTPEGLKKTEHVPLEESITHITGRKLNYILVGVIVLAVAFILFDNFYLDKLAIQTEVQSRVAELAPPAVEKEGAIPATPVAEEEDTRKTIAVLPFVNMSSDPEQGYFADGLSEELLNSLAQISDLRVIARTSSFAFKGKAKTVQEIAGALGADYILEGSVRRDGNALRIIAQLIQAVDSIHIWSKTYDRELKDIFEVQENIATAVADELKVTLGVGESLKQLGGTENLEAYELYLLAGEQMHDGERGLALKNIDAAIALDPEFSIAWVLKSDLHSVNYISDFSDLSASELEEALRAVETAMELEPDLAEAYTQLGRIRLSQGEFFEAASAYRKASEVSNNSTGGIVDYDSGFLAVAGYLKAAHEVMLETRLTNPIDAQIRGEYIAHLAFIGDMKGAEEEYESGKEMFGDGWVFGNMAITTARLGSGQPVSSDDIVVSEPIHNTAKEHLDSPKEGLKELHRFYNNSDYQNPMSLTPIAYWAAYFDDPDFAMDAIEKAVGMDAENIKLYWCPLFKKVRELQRYKELVKKIGLVKLWNELGWPDLCHSTDDGDFVFD